MVRMNPYASQSPPGTFHPMTTVYPNNLPIFSECQEDSWAIKHLHAIFVGVRPAHCAVSFNGGFAIWPKMISPYGQYLVKGDGFYFRHMNI